MAETVCINICDFEELTLLYNTDQNINWLGRPVWELMPKNKGDDKSTKTFLGRLVPVSRAICLFDGNSKMLYGEALRYSIYPDFPREFNTSVVVKRVKKKEERYLVGARLGIRPWRQLDAILQYNISGKTSSHAINLAHLDGVSIDIWVGALLRNPGKQDILDTVESRFHITNRLRSEIGCSTYAAEVQKAQAVSKLLDVAVFLYRIELDSREGKGLGSTAIYHYWTSVEKNLAFLMIHIESIGTDDAVPTREAWRKMLFASACDAYRIACGQETPRQMRAFAKGWQKLTTKKDKPETDTQETKEEDV